MDKREKMILTCLMTRSDFARKVFPFLKTEYFDKEGKILFDLISDHTQKYSVNPNPAQVELLLEQVEDVPEEYHSSALEFFNELEKNEFSDVLGEWLIDQTEEFCKDKALYNAMMKSIQIMQSKETSGLSKGAIPSLMTDALSISFDPNIGHDFLKDWEERFDYYHEDTPRIKFDLECLNSITRGGLIRKTLNILTAGTNVGKTMAMCHMSAGFLNDGYNVLYITLEMGEKEIAKRIEANVLDTPLEELEALSKEAYEKRVKAAFAKISGRLIIKEFPTAGASVGHFSALTNDLRLKEDFVPDVIVLDYLNLCLSARIKIGTSTNSYTYVKSVVEEIRGFMVKENAAGVSATQFSRGGNNNIEAEITETSDSFGTAMTVDLDLAMVQDEEMAAKNLIMFKQLKTRYGDRRKNRKFMVGVDYSKMRLYDVDNSYDSRFVDTGDEEDEKSTSSQKDTGKAEKFNSFNFGD